MIGLLKLVWGATGGKWLLIAPLIALAAMGVALKVETARLSHVQDKLSAMTALRLQERDNHRQTKANFASAMAQAKLDADAARLRIENQWKGQVDASETNGRIRLDDALRAAERMLAARPSGTCARSVPGQTRIPAPATTAADPARASAMSQLDASDVRVCTANTVKALSWQEFYAGLRANPQPSE
jgi:hypothetical protein